MSLRCVCVLLLLASEARAAEFIPLGDLPGGGFVSVAYGVDAQGLNAVGVSNGGSQEAFLWNEIEGMRSFTDGSSLAAAISADGTVVGRAINPASGLNEPYRWSESTGLVYLGTLSVAPIGTGATDVSADGSVVVGESFSAGTYEAYRWTEATGMIGLGALPGDTRASVATAVSADGSVIVGQSRSAQGPEAFVWNAQSGMMGLGDLPGGDFRSVALNVSPDGGFVVGTGSSNLSSTEAFRWDTVSGMVGLGLLEGSNGDSVPSAVSEFGRAIVGGNTMYGSVQTTFKAFLWDEVHGMRDLQCVLSSQHGLATSLKGWQLWVATDISANAKSIVGYGINPDGNTEAWLVRLDRPIFVPEPSTMLLAALSLAGALCYHRPRSG